MTFDTSTSTTKSASNSINGDTIVANEKEILQVETDLAQTPVSELLSEDLSLLESDDVAELLQRLSSADNMAQGMESKINGVLQNLDELLSLLGVEETSTTSEDTPTPGDPVPDDSTKISSGP